MTENIDIKAISREVNRTLQKMERAQEERTRRAYKPAKTRPSAPRRTTCRGYSQPRARIC